MLVKIMFAIRLEYIITKIGYYGHSKISVNISIGLNIISITSTILCMLCTYRLTYFIIHLEYDENVFKQSRIRYYNKDNVYN